MQPERVFSTRPAASLAMPVSHWDIKIRSPLPVETPAGRRCLQKLISDDDFSFREVHACKAEKNFTHDSPESFDTRAKEKDD
jgi:hypothetical protein